MTEIEVAEFSGTTTEEFWCILRPDGSMVRKSPHWGSAFWKTHPVGVSGYPLRSTDRASVELYGVPDLVDALTRLGIRPADAAHQVVRVVVATSVGVFMTPPKDPDMTERQAQDETTEGAA